MFCFEPGLVPHINLLIWAVGALQKAIAGGIACDVLIRKGMPHRNLIEDYCWLTAEWKCRRHAYHMMLFNTFWFRFFNVRFAYCKKNFVQDCSGFLNNHFRIVLESVLQNLFDITTLNRVLGDWWTGWLYNKYVSLFTQKKFSKDKPDVVYNFINILEHIYCRLYIQRLLYSVQCTFCSSAVERNCTVNKFFQNLFTIYIRIKQTL